MPCESRLRYVSVNEPSQDAEPLPRREQQLPSREPSERHDSRPLDGDPMSGLDGPPAQSGGRDRSAGRSVSAQETLGRPGAGTRVQRAPAAPRRGISASRADAARWRALAPARGGHAPARGSTPEPRRRPAPARAAAATRRPAAPADLTHYAGWSP